MKKAMIDRNDPVSAKEPVAELTPAPAERHTHTIVMKVFGRRFELRSHVEIREIAEGPAKVIQMPQRPTV